jgi:hypothetical protein
MKAWFLFFFAALALGQQGTSRRIGIIDFFGYKGLDLAAIRSALPLHEGDPFDPEHFDEDLFNLAVERIAGRKPTDLGKVCCDDSGNYLLYIGLQGGSYRPVAFHAAPTSKVRLPTDLKHAAEAADKAFGQAIMSGHAEEDDSQGFALPKDPKARARTLDYRKVALREEKAILNVLTSSAIDQERAAAAQALGYVDRSDSQIAALVAASLDPGSEVRNNAVRALEVLVEAFPEISAKIPAHPFVLLLSSGTWTDRNKASIMLERLTRSRDRQLLDLLRAEALDSLVEMARWRSPGHAWAAKMILGRMVGVEEQDLDKTDTERVIGAAMMGKRN